MKTKALELYYRYKRNKLPKYFESMFTESNDIHSHDTRHKPLLYQLPTKTSKYQCCRSIDSILNVIQNDRVSVSHVLGDLNINLLCPRDSQCIRDVVETHGLENIISDPTCFKSEKGSLLDVIFRYKTKSRIHEKIFWGLMQSYVFYCETKCILG